MASKPRRSSARISKQSGGTFLGVILGLIVGLAIAVVVAFYINRSPAPFVAHNPQPAIPADTTAATAAAPANTDPNRPLAGNSPGVAVAPSAQPAPPNTAPGQPSNPSTGLLDEPQIVEVPQTDNTTPAAPASHWPGSRAAPAVTPPNMGSPASPARPAIPGVPVAPMVPNAPATPGTADANTGYLLQVGAYRTQADAEQQRARLALLGFDAHVTRRDSGVVTFFRVRMGPFAKFDDMNNARQRLSNAGVDTAVIRFTRQ
jgi:cell division protein FtsN